MENEVTPEELENAILLVTGSPEWKVIQRGLFNEIQASQASSLFLPTWERVNEEKGFVRGLMYCVTLREQMIAAKKQAEDNANV